MNKIDKTICFFWVGDKIEIPQSLVQSIRLTMGDKVNVVQLTNYETKEIKGVNSVKRFDLSSKIMIARLQSYNLYENETNYTFFCDADCVFINKLSLPNIEDINIFLSPRLKDFKINYNYPEYYEEFVDKTANEVMPFLFCAIATKGNQQKFFKNLLNICLKLPNRFHNWYGDQYSLFLETKTKLKEFGLLDPNIYQYEIKEVLMPKKLEQIIEIGCQILHFKGSQSKIHIEQTMVLLNYLVNKRNT